MGVFGVNPGSSPSRRTTRRRGPRYLDIVALYFVISKLLLFKFHLSSGGVRLWLGEGTSPLLHPMHPFRGARDARVAIEPPSHRTPRPCPQLAEWAVGSLPHPIPSKALHPLHPFRGARDARPSRGRLTFCETSVGLGLLAPVVFYNLYFKT
ncbi:hypothetical protein COCOBI_pt-1210 (chloroplast) [Coccomyxa sp. Obi]|nr:hypothetical protein COCOBI_pt-1210 [Coccomyxa sp. Obi]